MLILESSAPNMFGTIDEYGPFTVILGVILIIVIVLVRSINSSIKTFIQQSIENDKHYKQIMEEQNKAILEQLINNKQEIIEQQQQPEQPELVRRRCRSRCPGRCQGEVQCARFHGHDRCHGRQHCLDGPPVARKLHVGRLLLRG